MARTRQVPANDHRTAARATPPSHRSDTRLRELTRCQRARQTQHGQRARQSLTVTMIETPWCTKRCITPNICATADNLLPLRWRTDRPVRRRVLISAMAGPLAPGVAVDLPPGPLHGRRLGSAGRQRINSPGPGRGPAASRRARIPVGAVSRAAGRAGSVRWRLR